MSVESVTSQFSKLSVESSSSTAVVASSNSPLIYPKEICGLIRSYLPLFTESEEEQIRNIERLLEERKISVLSQSDKELLCLATKLDLTITKDSSSLSEILKLTPCMQELTLRSRLQDEEDEKALSLLQYLNRLFLTKITDVGLTRLRNLRIEKIILKDTGITGKGFESWEESISPATEIRLLNNDKINETHLAFLGQLQRLKKIHISDFNITGQGFANWRESQLETLTLNDCEVFNDESLALLADYLPNLKELVLYNMSSITGIGFANWGKSKLQKIRIDQCRNFKETHIELLAKLPNLKEITFELISITGVGFASWDKSKLQKIRLIDCYNFNDDGLACMGSLPHLEEVHFHTRGDTNILGKGFEKWTQSPVQKIEFLGAILNDTGLSYLGRLQQLQGISISFSNGEGFISGEGFATWDQSPVRKVSLDSCRNINDIALGYLGRLQQLQEISLNYLEITGDGFNTWSDSSVRKINLQNSTSINEFGVALLSTLPKLQEIVLEVTNATKKEFATWSRSSIKRLIIPKHRHGPVRILEKAEALIEELEANLPNVKIERLNTD